MRRRLRPTKCGTRQRRHWAPRNGPVRSGQLPRSFIFRHSSFIIHHSSCTRIKSLKIKSLKIKSLKSNHKDQPSTHQESPSPRSTRVKIPCVKIHDKRVKICKTFAPLLTCCRG